MNKEVIIENKQCFDYWLDGGKVLFKVNGNDFRTRAWWTLSNGNGARWEDDTTYIMDDKYAEFRKAVADGKEVQDNTGLDWSKSLCRWDLPPCRYRIKPDEPKFKVGDWISSTRGARHIELLTSKRLKELLAHTVLLDFYALWTPRIGDAIICKSSCGRIEIAEVIHIDGMLMTHDYTPLVSFETIIPYIGQLFGEMK